MKSRRNLQIRPCRLVATSMMIAPAAIFAQPSTARSGAEAIHLVYHNWEPKTSIRVDSMQVVGVQQAAVPLNWRIGERRRVSFEISGGGAMSRVAVKSGDSTLRRDLSGPTDTRAQFTILGARDHLAIFVGGTIPTGLTKLKSNQLSALSVLASPAVRSPVAAFGGGAAGNAGATVTMPLATWMLTVGGGYERRFRYAPFSELTIGVPVDATIAPGSIMSFSGRLDGVVLGTAISLDGNVRQFLADTFAVKQGAQTLRSVYRLGPMSAASIRIQPTTKSARDLVLMAGVQRRAPYEILDRGRVEGSGTTLKNVGIAGTLLRAGGWRIGAGAEILSYSGIKSDSSLVAAAFRENSASVNFAIPTNDGELILTFAGSTGNFTLLNKPAIAMRRLTAHVHIQVF